MEQRNAEQHEAQVEGGFVLTHVQFTDTELYTTEETLDEVTDWLETAIEKENRERAKTAREPVEHPFAGWQRQEGRQYVSFEERDGLIALLKRLAAETTKTPGAHSKKAVEFMGTFATVLQQLHEATPTQYIVLQLNDG